MWIIITKRVPTEVPVPKLSVHWSTPWPMDTGREGKPITKKQWTRKGYTKQGFDYDECDGIPPSIEDRANEMFGNPFGRTPDYAGARKIRFKNNNIRVFPHEFNPMSQDTMKLLINEGALLLQKQDDVATDVVIEDVLDGVHKVIYEEALVAGCDHAQAMMVAFGLDPTIPDAEMPPIGWYKCAPQYATFFCREWEMDPEDQKVLAGATVKVDGTVVPVKVTRTRRTRRKTK